MKMLLKAGASDFVLIKEARCLCSYTFVELKSCEHCHVCKYCVMHAHTHMHTHSPMRAYEHCLQDGKGVFALAPMVTRLERFFIIVCRAAKVCTILL